jgi:alpha-mannosidase
VARSAIYAQGYGKNWYNPLESYEYADIGKQAFTFVLRPHGEALPVAEAYRMARRVNGAFEYLADSCHSGKEQRTTYTFASTDQLDVAIMVIKKAEDDEDYIVRILEQGGKDQTYCLTFLGVNYNLVIGHNEIQTLKINPNSRTVKHVNLLEYERRF